MTQSDSPEISHASGSLVWGTDGRCFIDLKTGFGAVFLGHAHPRLMQALQDQVFKVWACGRSGTAAGIAADALVRKFLPPGFKAGGLYSTGMEAAEFAMRLAAYHSGRHEFAGFERSMHGKSAMTASLCWANAPIRVEGVHVLPFTDQLPEDDILDQLSRLLKTRRIAALFVEPVQGSNGGHGASSAFYHGVIALCRQSGTYCVFDEILTGLFRTGSAFYIDSLAVKPDFLLFAKSMANGFPVSSLAIREDMDMVAQALPGSTFSGNPLASAAVAATLEVMSEIDMVHRVTAIERTVREMLEGHHPDLLTLRGRGALWMLELGSRVKASQALAAICRNEVLVSSQGHYVRLLPAATIDLETLRDACSRIVDAIESAYD